MPPHVYAAQYQQRPIAGGSGMLSVDKWRRYDPEETSEFELIIDSWDIGATVGGNATVCTTRGLARDKDGRDVLYLLNVQRLHLELPEVRAAILASNRANRPALIIIDERGVGLGVYQDLKRQGLTNLTRSTATSEALQLDDDRKTRPSASKIERFGRAGLYIGDGLVLIPRHAPWLDAFLNEVTGFPNISNDDQVDSVAQLVANFERAIMLARHNVSRR